MMMSGLFTNMAMSVMPHFDVFPSVVERLHALFACKRKLALEVDLLI